MLIPAAIINLGVTTPHVTITILRVVRNFLWLLSRYSHSASIIVVEFVNALADFVWYLFSPSFIFLCIKVTLFRNKCDRGDTRIETREENGNNSGICYYSTLSGILKNNQTTNTQTCILGSCDFVPWFFLGTGFRKESRLLLPRIRWHTVLIFFVTNKTRSFIGV